MKKFLFVIILLFGASAGVFSQSDAAAGISSFLPSDGLDGWHAKGAPAGYDASNLYLYIDGAAEMYIDYGFKSLLSAEYAKEGEEGTMIVDIYDMGDKDCAFGIYAAEKDETAKRVAAGAEGYVSGSILNFWKERFYVKISTAGPIKDAERVLNLFADEVDKKIPGGKEYPDRAMRLNTEGMISGSIKYSPKSFLGHAFITNTYSAQYKVGEGKPFRLFISEYKTLEEALSAFDKYRDFVSKDKEVKVEELAGLGEAAFFYRDRFGKEYLILKEQNFLCGADGEKIGEEEKSLLEKIGTDTYFY